MMRLFPNISSLMLLLSLVAAILAVDGVYPTLKDGDTIYISLQNYNVSNPSGESIEHFYILLPNSSITISIVDIPGDAVYVLQQAHTFFHNVGLSYLPAPTYHTSVNGTNVGLWSSDVDPMFHLHYWGDNAQATVMLAIQAYNHQAPIPGGCNMEFPTEIAPYLQTTYNNSTVSVQFAAASPPYSVLVWMGLVHNHSCTVHPDGHTVYRAYLPERDFTQDVYFSALQRMMTLGRIQASAHVVPHMTNSPALKRIFAAYPGTGSAYVVVVSAFSQSAVYVPSISYACDASVNDNTCMILETTFSKVLSAIIFFLGLFACLAAHRFFLVETLLLGFLAGGLIIYTSLYNFSTTPDDVLSVAVVGGLAVGVALVLCWCCFPFPLISIILASSILGYLISAIVIVPIGDYIDLTSELNFWICFACLMLLVPTLCVPLAERANVAATSFVGAYAAIVPIDYYVGAHLRFLLLNSLRRTTVPGFKWAVIDMPLQINDIFLAILWVILMIAGCACQHLLIRNKPPFPAPSHARLRRWYRRVRGPTSPATIVIVANERTPLIAQSA